MGKHAVLCLPGGYLPAALFFVLCVTGIRADVASPPPAAPDSQFFDAGGVKIHYVRQGTGEPVVLIHGLYASAALNWEMPGVFAALARDHDVIALDLPGHGLSDKPDLASAYGAQLVQDVILLLDHLKIRKAHIVGYSLGGMITLKFIAEHPDRALSGTLGGMGWMPEGSDQQKMFAHMRAIQFFSTPAVCVTTMGQLAVSQPEIKAIKLPMEVLVGEEDGMNKLFVDPLKSARPDWPVIEIKDADHLTCVMKPQFLDALVKWIETNRQP
jgi:pimeloyl-ACP methyl ester carboxylesterase